MDNIANLALRERVACNIADRIPTARFPFFGTTLQHTIPKDAAPSHLFLLEPERDYLFTDMSVRAWYVDRVSGDAVEVDATVTITYCNTTYANGTDTAAFRYCCSGKGPVLLGLRDNKKLRIRVDVDAAALVDNDVHVEVSLNGFQGDGCCG